MPRAGIFGSARTAGGGGAAYASAVLADSPVLYWRLGESSGTVAADASGNSRTGTYEGTYTQAVTGLAGDSNTAVDFSGSGSIARAYEAWQDDTTFTIEAIIKADATSSYRAIAACDGIAGHRFWTFYVKDGKLLLFYAGDGDEAVIGATTLSTGTRYHVALTSDGVNEKVWLNGVQDGTATRAMAAPAGTSRMFTVGASIAGGVVTTQRSLTFDGVIDEVAYYSSALSSTRLLAHANAAGL